MIIGRNHRTHCYEIPTVFVALAIRRRAEREQEEYLNWYMPDESTLAYRLRALALRAWRCHHWRNAVARVWRTLNDIRSFTLTTGGR